MNYGATVAGARLITLGLLSLVMVGSLPVTLEASGLGVLLFGAPVLIGSVLALLTGYASWRTWIQISDDGLVVQAPAWRACPLPPLRRFTLGWHEVRAIRSRSERYRMLGLERPVEVCEIDAAWGPIVLGVGFVPDLEEILLEVARRAGCLWIEDGEVELHPLRTLLRGAPPWPHDFQPGTAAVSN